MQPRRLLIGAALLGTALYVPAQTFTEQGDAGNLPGTAQVVAGSGPLAQIDGAIDDPTEPNGAGNDRDMYLIHIDDPTTFEATTTNGTTLDTQLWLFDTTGHGIAFNDDDPLAIGGLRSRLTGAFVTAPGDYLLAISRFDRDATAGTDEIWQDTPFNTERQPDGPGAANAIDGWNGLVATSVTGTYSIFLTGASFVGQSCSNLTVTTSGADLTFALTGADPDALALVVISSNQGPFTIHIGPLGTLELGVAPPFLPAALGRTDSQGDASLTVRVPNGIPAMNLFAQAFSMDIQFGHPPALTFCTSDVEAFHVGN